MKKSATLFFYLACFLPVHAQQLTLTGNNMIVTGNQVDKNSWYFDMNDSVMILMNMKDFNKLIAEIEYLRADTAKTRRIIDVNNDLISKYENYEAKADSHIVVQEKLIDTADSLYKGYKDLYSDLKKIYGISTFSLIPGVGLLDLPSEDRRTFVGSIGVEYNKWQGQFQLGKNYKAIVVGLRIPVF
jgi:hypothetical protein